MTGSAAAATRSRRVAVVTGAMGGIVIHVAAGLVAVGHQVLVTGRNQARGAAAIDLLRRQAPGGLASLGGRGSQQTAQLREMLLALLRHTQAMRSSHQDGQPAPTGAHRPPS